jgi:hypothetical protein
MSTTQTLEQLTAQHGLWARWTSAEGFHADPDGWEHHRFRFEWGIGDETIGSNIPFRQGTGHDEDPSEQTLLWAVLSDAGTAAPYRETPFDDAWVESADDLGFFSSETPVNPETIRAQREAFRSCRAWDELLRERLGDDVTDELIEAAGQV